MAEFVKKIRTASGDLQIDYNALANLPTISNPNLLINSDFRNPVNQRGSTTYIGGANKVYTIDRWCHNVTDVNRTLEVCNGYIRYANPSTDHQGFWLQQFERALGAGDYTITVNVKSVSGDAWVGNLLSSDWGNKTTFLLTPGINTFTFNGDCAGLYFQTSINASVELYWVKLEYGRMSTLFAPKSYDEEFLICQRYYQTTYLHRTIRSDVYNEQIIETIPYGIALRRIPTLTVTNQQSFNISYFNVSDDGKTNIYRVAYELSSEHGVGHMFEFNLAIDAEIY